MQIYASNGTGYDSVIEPSYMTQFENQSSGKPAKLIKKNITENGEYSASSDNANGYSTVNVNVPNTYTAGDEGKVVNNGTLVAQTAYPTEITENDTYDTTNYNSITVNVSGGGSSSVVAICTFEFSENQFFMEDVSGMIADSAFSECYPLTSITIPNGVTSIGENAFANCAYLATVTFEANSSLETIEDYAFQQCSALTSITIPNSVTSIGEAAFYVCSALETVTFEDNSNLESIGLQAFQQCSALTSITIPSSVISISGDAFYRCDALATVTFEANSSLESIEDSVFFHCSALTSITIPNSVTSIGESVFYECSALETVTFEDNSNLESIGLQAFDGCSVLTSITIPNSVTSIGSDAFYGCEALTSITFESSTPPELSGGIGIPTTCIIRVPQGSLSAYTSASNYPDPSEYIYEEY